MTDNISNENEMENHDEKGRFSKGNTGRPKGSLNKFTTLKASFLSAFVELGGQEELVEWGKHHKTQFYKILAKMLPADTNLTIDTSPKTIIIKEYDVNKSVEENQKN
jgi:hypothetical protein